VLQKWQMSPIFVSPEFVRPGFVLRAAFARRLFLAASLALSAVMCAGPKYVWAQAITPVQSDQSQQPQITKSPEGKKEEAERAAERAKAHHFDRVLIIVLENVDYERAIQDKNLAALAQHGASFTNFHAMFHPSYPNYLAMVAGTDFGIHRRGSFLGDKQLNFPNDAAHKTIADRLIAFQPEHGPRQCRQPGFVQRPAPHCQTARVVARAPIQELDGRLVTRAARGDRVKAVARDLPRPQSREPSGRRDDEEDYQLELRDQRIAPPAERS